MPVKKLDEACNRIIRNVTHVFVDGMKETSRYLFLQEIVLDTRIATLGMILRMSRTPDMYKNDFSF